MSPTDALAALRKRFKSLEHGRECNIGLLRGASLTPLPCDCGLSDVRDDTLALCATLVEERDAAFGAGRDSQHGVIQRYHEENARLDAENRQLLMSASMMYTRKLEAENTRLRAENERLTEQQKNHEAAIRVAMKAGAAVERAGTELKTIDREGWKRSLDAAQETVVRELIEENEKLRAELDEHTGPLIKCNCDLAITCREERHALMDSNAKLRAETAALRKALEKALWFAEQTEAHFIRDHEPAPGLAIIKDHVVYVRQALAPFTHASNIGGSRHG